MKKAKKRRGTQVTAISVDLTAREAADFLRDLVHDEGFRAHLKRNPRQALAARNVVLLGPALPRKLREADLPDEDDIAVLLGRRGNPPAFDGRCLIIAAAYAAAGATTDPRY